MSTFSKQTTLTEMSIVARKRRLPWDSDNPKRADVPDLHEPTIRQYREAPGELPYDVPTVGGSEQSARNKHRTWFWLENPFGEYVCPDCERLVAECRRVDLHHIDGDPRNGTPGNLVGLCRYCHRQRHGEGGRQTMRPVGIWKRDFSASIERGGD